MTKNVYVWLAYISKSGSSSQRLLMAKDNMVLVKVIRAINNMDPMELYNQCPSWLVDNLKTIRVSVQEIGTGKVFYARILEPEVHAVVTTMYKIGPVIGKFREEYDAGRRDNADYWNSK